MLETEKLKRKRKKEQSKDNMNKWSMSEYLPFYNDIFMYYPRNMWIYPLNIYLFIFNSNIDIEIPFSSLRKAKEVK